MSAGATAVPLESLAAEPAVAGVRLEADVDGDTGGDGSDRLVVLFDRDCGLCTATAARLRRWDRRHALELLPLQDVEMRGSAAVREAVAGRPLTSELHVVDVATGEVSSGGRAALAIIGRLPHGELPATIAGMPPAGWVVGLGYQLVARNRHRIGRWLRLEGPACDVPR